MKGDASGRNGGADAQHHFGWEDTLRRTPWSIKLYQMQETMRGQDIHEITWVYNLTKPSQVVNKLIYKDKHMEFEHVCGSI